MGVRRYSRDEDLARWQQEFDRLQMLCGWGWDDSPTIKQLTDHGITRARWRCSGGFECYHGSKEFELSSLNGRLKVATLRRRYFCSQCSRPRPNLELLWYGEGP